jgi:hypothetical protein
VTHLSPRLDPRIRARSTFCSIEVSGAGGAYFHYAVILIPSISEKAHCAFQRPVVWYLTKEIVATLGSADAAT